MKCSVNSFLNLLKNRVLDVQENEPSNQFKNGVNATLELMKYWFEDNHIKDFDVNVKLY